MDLAKSMDLVDPEAAALDASFWGCRHVWGPPDR